MPKPGYKSITVSESTHKLLQNLVVSLRRELQQIQDKEVAISMEDVLRAVANETFRDYEFFEKVLSALKVRRNE